MVQGNAFALLTLCLATGGVLAAQTPAFQASSPDVVAGQPIAAKFIYNGFGCTGQNVSPAVMWKNAPAGTKSFALMVHDPDAPTGGAGFWHWIVYNIPADTTSLPEGGPLPKGAVEGNTDMGKPGYVGPCPPAGPKHHYNFMLYPLKVDKLDVPPGATASYVGFNAGANVIGKPAKLTAVYARPKEPAAAKPEPAKEMKK